MVFLRFFLKEDSNFTLRKKHIMKKSISKLVLVAGIVLGTVSCKDDTKNELNPGEAQDAAVATEEAVSYEIDTTKSSIEWKGTKPTGEHIGTIDISEGTLMATNDSIISGEVTIDMNTITVLDEDMEEKDRTSLENHLKGTVEGKETDFFNVEKYPTATFEITGVTEENGETLLSLWRPRWRMARSHWRVKHLPLTEPTGVSITGPNRFSTISVITSSVMIWSLRSASLHSDRIPFRK